MNGFVIDSEKERCANLAKSWALDLEAAYRYSTDPANGDKDLYKDENSIEHILDDALGISASVMLYDGKETYDCATVQIAYGGPTTYIDGGRNVVRVYWGASQAEFPLDIDVARFVNEWVYENVWLPARKEAD